MSDEEGMMIPTV